VVHPTGCSILFQNSGIFVVRIVWRHGDDFHGGNANVEFGMEWMCYQVWDSGVLGVLRRPLVFAEYLCVRSGSKTNSLLILITIVQERSACCGVDTAGLFVLASSFLIAFNRSNLAITACTSLTTKTAEIILIFVIGFRIVVWFDYFEDAGVIISIRDI
jgi:hypothetical protein